LDLRLPAPLRPGDTIGVTAPSAGVTGAGAERIDFYVGWLRERGYGQRQQLTQDLSR
jgi:muramoyltetrapeptide carboxypeptidase